MTSADKMHVKEDITECIGHTPLVRLRRITSDCVASVYGKLENLNPLWSVKDRIAKAMIDDAEERGLIHPDTIIIEPTSGNTGIGLAYVCAARGYKLMVTMPESMSIERRRMLKALGAELVLTPATEGMPGAVRKAEELVAAGKKYYMPQQFNNPANPEIHRRTTAEEIWEDTAGKVDMIVAGVGTGGTITGIGEVLKNTQTEFEGDRGGTFGLTSDYAEVARGTAGAREHGIQGIGAGFIPGVLNLDILDEVLTVGDEEALETSRQMAKKEGFMCGISCGAAAWCAIQVAKRPENEGKMIVVILPDLESAIYQQNFSRNNYFGEALSFFRRAA